MNKRFLIILFLFSSYCTLLADIKLPQLISDGLILQRDKTVKLWGWAEAGEAIKLEFNNKTYKAKTDKSGQWSINLPPQKAGGPYEMVFKGKNELKVRDILFGDVWICAGQSNMVLPMERVKEQYPDEVANANNPEIRHFFIPTTTNLQGPQEDLPASSWKRAIKGEIMSFSATAYFFAKSVYEKHKIPIGLVNASVGGTPIQAWISEEGLKEFPKDLATIAQNKDTAYVNAQRAIPRPPRKTLGADKGLTETPNWYQPDYHPKGWNRINIPGFWEDQGLRNLNGVVWYRKEIDVPATMTDVPAKLFMGRIVDADEIYVNGQKVGNITYQYPPRRYNLEAGVLKPGKNLIVIRVSNYGNKGGFVTDKPYYLTANGHDIDLKGDWQYKVGQVFPPTTPGPRRFSAQNQPASLYNAMAAPLTKQPITGFLWYQGESNSGNPNPYREYLPALIKDWRSKWGQGDLPFLFVQLANFMEVDFMPTESKWAELRDAQLQALSVPNTAMAVTIDLGEWNDIHPLNKEDVGKRLALGALNLAYGDQSLTYSGPIYKSHQIDKNKMVLSFDHVGGGLTSIDGEPLQRFEVAGPDGIFHWADAKIEGHTVVVWNETIAHPEAVRYAWSDNPAGANLYNKNGLPASPFRTQQPAQIDELPWRGKEAAVVLTYDDALNVHLDNAIPLLDSLNLKATFYLSGFFPGFKERMRDWERAARNGHELGNHTLFHPCNGQLPGREWVNPVYDLSSYPVQRMIDEIRMTNVLLESIDGQKDRTFAFTCGDMKIGNVSFMDDLKNDFVGARAVRPELHTIDKVDLYNIDCYPINGESGQQLIELVEKARASNTLLVFLFHGVGGEHSLDVSLEAHRELLQYLKQNEHQVWTTTMREAIQNIEHHQNTNQ